MDIGAVERALLIVVSITQATWVASWIVGRWTQRQEVSISELSRRLCLLEGKPDGVILAHDVEQLLIRVDRAGKKQSDLVNTLQGMEERLRHSFLPREVADQWVRESREDRMELRRMLIELRP